MIDWYPGQPDNWGGLENHGDLRLVFNAPQMAYKNDRAAIIIQPYLCEVASSIYSVSIELIFITF